ncbi:ribonuclease [Arthrobacter sp. UM1]|nr:ribonuclease [Arthrobacter sp. UM1]
MQPGPRGQRSSLLARAGAAASLVLLLAGCGGADGSGSGGSAAPQGEGPAASAPSNPSDLPSVKESRLPAEARKTLGLIRTGGPFPYERDGVRFGNYERVLPQKKSGYYKEYTVKTPGASNRGAHRIVVGAGHEKYYTSDHYQHFRFIEEGR